MIFLIVSKLSNTLTPEVFALFDLIEVGSSLAVQRTLSDQDAEEDEGDDADFEDPDVVPQELRDLRQRLDYLKNLYERTEQVL